MILIALAPSAPTYEKQHEAGLLLSKKLISAAGFDTPDCKIKKALGGKPYIEGAEKSDFSISHSRSAALCAVICPAADVSGNAERLTFHKADENNGNNGYFKNHFRADAALTDGKVYVIDSCDGENFKIGADIEYVGSKDDPKRLKRISERFFSEDERKYIGDFERERFFEVWTKKESYFKMLGIGISGLVGGKDKSADLGGAAFLTFDACVRGERYIGSVCFE